MGDRRLSAKGDLARDDVEPDVLCRRVAGVGATYYAVTSLIGLSTDAVATHGWLIGPFPETHWRAIGAAWPTLVSVVALAVLGVVHNATGIEFGCRP
jgi:hypothetical protein